MTQLKVNNIHATNQAINYAFGAVHLRPDPLLQASLAGVGRLYQRYASTGRDYHGM